MMYMVSLRLPFLERFSQASFRQKKSFITRFSGRGCGPFNLFSLKFPMLGRNANHNPGGYVERHDNAHSAWLWAENHSPVLLNSRRRIPNPDLGLVFWDESRLQDEGVFAATFGRLSINTPHRNESATGVEESLHQEVVEREWIEEHRPEAWSGDEEHELLSRLDY